MGISIVRFLHPSSLKPTWGVRKPNGIHLLNISSSHHRDVISSYNLDRETFLSSISEDAIEQAPAEYLSPISQDIQLIAQGMNYDSHRAEGRVFGKDAEQSGHFENSLFYKASSSISKPNETILRPRGCKLLDYEIELGIVIKKAISSAVVVTDENLGDFIGGLVLANDVSARDIMLGAPVLQWYRGKSQRTFCPMGPVLYLMDRDEMHKIYAMRLRLSLNGRVMQDASTNLMIHKPPETLSDLSQFTNLNVGDCILTGTPGGILMDLNARTGLAIILNMNNDKKRRAKITAAQLARSKFLEPGDVLDLEIVSEDGSIDLGKQVNKIADA